MSTGSTEDDGPGPEGAAAEGVAADGAGADGARGDEPGTDGSGTLRRRVLDAALRLVERAGGLAVRAEALPFDAVLREAGVSRTSAYREWPGRDAFHADVLHELAGPAWQGSGGFDQGTVRLLRGAVAARLPELRTAEGRARVVREVVRLGARHSYEHLRDSVQWRTSVALTATVLGLPDPVQRDRVRAALDASEQASLELMTRVYADLFLVLGLRLRPGVPSAATVALAGAALVEGFAWRGVLAPEGDDAMLVVPGPDGPEEWHPVALAFLGLVEGLVEPDPDHDAETALRLYLTSLADQEAGRG
ncbi:TetR/AcrR family transcriptional regulator [Cellulomonas endophytica]|uniref:TetR/AcrR family transcriptional regulator n=1 Tax=Cellulomonas endophytica TaxID=2494735 RepID=UPI001011C0EC|nr:hypothetical protein [Cellulomonas endophytica]